MTNQVNEFLFPMLECQLQYNNLGTNFSSLFIEDGDEAWFFVIMLHKTNTRNQTNQQMPKE